ncbi:hypothetical protein Fmac_021969 [Flemingia macrophylla]|uniref:C2H2-type domain-containing protein n=1 Tax=Flemingia macrophylla TaxID=520843 RepID=A0ABD1LYD0_9FABA
MEMEMEGLDSNSTHNIAKGKRTKRTRLLSSVAATTATATATATATTTVVTSSCSSANSGASSTTTYESEEEDMANCLILLAQGRKSYPYHDYDEGNNTLPNTTTVVAAVTTTTAATATPLVNSKVGFYVYECKTCNRTFPSFQALGGHRASHKKPKLVGEERKAAPSELAHMIVDNFDRFEEANNVKSGPPISLQVDHGSNSNNNNNNKGKIHECSICGSEFTSGQALGGHMRRHRASTNTNSTTSCNNVNTARPRNVLQLDLNLPAPEDDLREAKFQFPALVDCHY